MMTTRSIALFLSNLWVTMYQGGRFVNGAPEEAYLIGLDAQQDILAVPIRTGAAGAHQVQLTQQQIRQALAAARLTNVQIIGLAHNHPPPTTPVVRQQVGAQTVTSCTVAWPMPSAADIDQASGAFLFNLFLSFYEVWIELRLSADDRRYYRLTNHGRLSSAGSGILAFRVAEYQTNRSSGTGGGASLQPQVPSLCSLKRHGPTMAADLRSVYALTFDEQYTNLQGQVSQYTTQWWQVVRTATGVRRSRSRADNPLTPNGFFPELLRLLRGATGSGAPSRRRQGRRRADAAGPGQGSGASDPLTQAPLELAESALETSNHEVLTRSFLDYGRSTPQAADELG